MSATQIRDLTMLFRSRKSPTLAERLHQLWRPRTSLDRSARYIWKRLFRLRASPHRIGVGVAAGVFASITPLIGVQMLMAGIITVLLRGSFTAAMLATFVGNPVTWPFIWGSTYAIGALMLGSPAAANMVTTGAGGQVWPVVYTMLVGSIPVGLIAAAFSYRLTTRAIVAVRGGTASIDADGRPTLAGRARAWAEARTAARWRLW